MTLRAARLLQLLDELRRRRQPVSGARLAVLTGTSLRTLYRDVEALRAQGADIAGDAGVGYLLRPGFLLPPMMFSSEELEAMVLGARWVVAHADPALAEAAGNALDRIVSVLPPALRLEADTNGLFAPEWSQLPAVPWLPALRQAIRQGHAVRLGYCDGEGVVSERVVWPFALAFLAEKRLLAAWCELRAQFRHFRADRVRWLQDTGQRYPAQRHALLRRWRAEQFGERGG